MRIVEREYSDSVYEACRRHGYLPAVARAIAGRLAEVPDNLDAALKPTLSHLDPPHTLSDMDKAVERIVRAIVDGEVIALCPDHDCDGATAGAVLWSALHRRFGVPAEKLIVRPSHRRTEGYGLNKSVVNFLLDHPAKPSLVITADCGSGDEESIAMLASRNCSTVVTDHHNLNDVPRSAVAVVSPKHPESTYPDTAIAGVYVAWLLMTCVMRELQAHGRVPKDAPKLLDELTFAAIGTQADCVSLLSRNSRAVIRYGLHQLNHGDTPALRAIRRSIRTNGGGYDSQTISFQIAPRIGAVGRLDHAHPGIAFLVAPDDGSAMQLLDELTAANEQRKAIQREMEVKARAIAEAQVRSGRRSIAVWLPDGNNGVHGIVASRFLEAFGRPCAMISPVQGQRDLCTMSFRSPPNLDIHRVLEQLNQEHPDLLVRWGGHRAAAGGQLLHENIERFQGAFEKVVREHLDEGDIGPTAVVDGEIALRDISLDLVAQLASLEPFGEGFSRPLYATKGVVNFAKRVGQDGQPHLQLRLSEGRCAVKGIWFHACRSATPSTDTEDAVAAALELPVAEGDTVRVLFRPTLNSFNGTDSAEILIEHAEVLTPF